ncbi:MAG TPA: type I DNA topoisomerase [Anaerolineales bacterium]|nr:type I DNA topoisomerase [Anaerolineales bacterium]HMX72680.1 type I DNA topoisomerase [Anaerolineales bacterium]HNC87569.1 type I DNA topoisomerase [Anaerolineales bacterium]HND90195.1 type I DNA topoisomerase [Anaerolineales bacterium]HNH06085.1 type I DNA topoisomerase [Anaerolineales bacterium]
MKCKTKREMKDPVAGFNAKGSPVTTGTCPECGTKLYRMGKTDAHADMVAPPRPEKVVVRDGKLVIVESPAKAKTVGRFLGKGYTVRASVGHVRDLLKSQLSVDVENNFEPKYRVPNEKKDVVKEIKKLASTAEEIYLATDPDREGESISWHLMEAAQIEPERTKRVVFHEITAPAVAEAFSHPREINMDLVNAQQARRVLDRLVGYSISPILWEKVRGRLSAGRVQSVALRLIVDREREIDEFKPVEYWSIHAELKHGSAKTSFLSKLVRIDDKEPELPNEETVRPILVDMETAAYAVTKVKRGERRRKPAGPFTTSTLQQEASRKLGFTAKRTMGLAQGLYEGQDVGEGGTTGLITYMRTDSMNVSALAQNEAREYVSGKYGSDYLPAEAPMYKTKSAGAQEAHEAIRPTSVMRDPEKVKEFLDPAMFKLYRLIWQRFVASQMESAVFDTLQVEVTGKTSAHEYLLRASGSAVKFPGFLVVYEEAKNEDVKTEEDEENVKIPAGIAEGQEQELVRLIPEQHFTQPPPRFSEASLVQTLEENGIGRPSTYAPTISTIQQRGYVERVDKRLIPTDTGLQVNDLMVQYFPEVVDFNFTAHMEEDLDKIADGEMIWTDAIREFYNPFAEDVKKAQAEMPVTKSGPEPIGRACPTCGKELVIRYGRFGKFISCSGFPECRYTEPWLEKIGVSCPKDHGDLVERKTRKGRTFFGCMNYPNCDFTSWKRPIAVPCPKCSGLLVIANKREAQCTNCSESFLLEEIMPETVE